MQQFLQELEALRSENRKLKSAEAERASIELQMREAETRYRQMFEKNASVQLLIDPQSGYILDANVSAAAFYSCSIEQLRGRNISDINALSYQQVQAELEQAQLEQRSYFIFRHRLTTGELRDVEIYSSPILLGGRPLLHSVVHDVTPRRRIEAALRGSELRYRQMVEQTSDILYRADRMGNLLYLNPVGQRLLDVSENELQGRNLRSFLQPDDRAEAEAFYVEQLRKRIPNTHYEFRLLVNDGGAAWHERWFGQNVDLLVENGRVIGWQGLARDITDRRNAEQQRTRQMDRIAASAIELEVQNAELERSNETLRALATTDYLTGLRNRRAFREQLERDVQRAIRYRQPLSLLMIDVDGFKQYNDTFGHPEGDLVLKEVGRMLQEKARSTDFVARYGGEEFAVILTETDGSGAMRQAERLRQLIETSQRLHGRVTASFGAASVFNSEASSDQLIAQADTALYAAKQAGRNCTQHFDLIADGSYAVIDSLLSRSDEVNDDDLPLKG